MGTVLEDAESGLVLRREQTLNGFNKRQAGQTACDRFPGLHDKGWVGRAGQKQEAY